jgi:hypothetical protein
VHILVPTGPVQDCRPGRDHLVPRDADHLQSYLSPNKCVTQPSKPRRNARCPPWGPWGYSSKVNLGSYFCRKGPQEGPKGSLGGSSCARATWDPPYPSYMLDRPLEDTYPTAQYGSHAPTYPHNSYGSRVPTPQRHSYYIQMRLMYAITTY